MLGRKFLCVTADSSFVFSSATDSSAIIIYEVWSWNEPCKTCYEFKKNNYPPPATILRIRHLEP